MADMTLRWIRRITVCAAAMLGVFYVSPGKAIGLTQKIVGEERDPSPVQFLERLNIATTPGDIVPPKFNFAALSPREYLRFFLLARGSWVGWFRPLYSTFGEGAAACDLGVLRLQSSFVASIHEPAWCPKEQREAAQFLYQSLNGDDEGLSDKQLQRIFFLAHTAG